MGLGNVTKGGWELGCSLPVVTMIVSCSIEGSMEGSFPDNVRYSLDSVLICSHIFFITVVDYDWRICAALLFPVQNTIIPFLPEMFPLRSASLPKSCCVSWSWAFGISIPFCVQTLFWGSIW